MAKIIFNVVAEKLYAANAGHGITLQATSGKGSCMSNPACADLAWKGPIPAGNYFCKGNELSDKPLFWDVGRTLINQVDFGDWRIPLHSTTGGSRSGFFIHCGTKQGSAGCIDVGGGLLGSDKTDFLKQILMFSQYTQVTVI